MHTFNRNTVRVAVIAMMAIFPWVPPIVAMDAPSPPTVAAEAVKFSKVGESQIVKVIQGDEVVLTSKLFGKITWISLDGSPSDIRALDRKYINDPNVSVLIPKTIRKFRIQSIGLDKEKDGDAAFEIHWLQVVLNPDGPTPAPQPDNPPVVTPPAPVAPDAFTDSVAKALAKESITDKAKLNDYIGYFSKWGGDDGAKNKKISSVGELRKAMTADRVARIGSIFPNLRSVIALELQTTLPHIDEAILDDASRAAFTAEFSKITAALTWAASH